MLLHNQEVFNKRKEFLIKLLIDISSFELSNQFIFKWDTCLMIFSWLNRFSEDLDFSTLFFVVKRGIALCYQALRCEMRSFFQRNNIIYQKSKKSDFYLVNPPKFPILSSNIYHSFSQLWKPWSKNLLLMTSSILRFSLQHFTIFSKKHKQILLHIFMGIQPKTFLSSELQEPMEKLQL